MDKCLEEKKSFWSVRNPFMWGIIVTGVLLSLYLFLAFQIISIEGIKDTRLNFFLLSSPNEVGDTLAGLAGGLAFLWIVITVMLQSQELAEQRKELRQSRKEYKKMASAMKEQVRLMEVQGEIFQDEQKQRTEDRADRLLQRKLESLQEFILNQSRSSKFFGLQFELEGLSVTGDIDRQPVGLTIQKHNKFVEKYAGTDEFFSQLPNRVKNRRLYCEVNETPKSINIESLELMEDVINKVSTVMDMNEDLSEPSKVRMATLRIRETFSELIKLQKFLSRLPTDDHGEEKNP